MDTIFVNNVGEKIKTFAKVFLIAGIIATVIACIVIPCVMGFYEDSFVVCVITVVGSLLVFPIGFFVLYGFGQLITDTSEYKKYLYILATSKAQENASADAVAKTATAAPAVPAKTRTAAPLPTGKKCPKCGGHNPSFAQICKHCDHCF